MSEKAFFHNIDVPLSYLGINIYWLFQNTQENNIYWLCLIKLKTKFNQSPRSFFFSFLMSVKNSRLNYLISLVKWALWHHYPWFNRPSPAVSCINSARMSASLLISLQICIWGYNCHHSSWTIIWEENNKIVGLHPHLSLDDQLYCESYEVIEELLQPVGPEQTNNETHTRTSEHVSSKSPDISHPVKRPDFFVMWKRWPGQSTWKLYSPSIWYLYWKI